MSAENPDGRASESPLGAGGYTSLVLSALGFLLYWQAISTHFVDGEMLSAIVSYAAPFLFWVFALLLGVLNLEKRRPLRKAVTWLPVLMPFLAWLIFQVFWPR